MKFCSVIFFFRCDDYLKLFLYLERPEVNENSKDDVVLCGNISNLQQKTFYSKSRSLIMEFHTTVPHRDQLLYYKGYSGFRGLFRFKDESKSCANLIIAIIVDPLIVYPCFHWYCVRSLKNCNWNSSIEGIQLPLFTGESYCWTIKLLIVWLEERIQSLID